MLNLVLFSASNSDSSVLEYAEDNVGDQIGLHAVLDNVGGFAALSNRHAFASHHFYESCDLTRWEPAVLSLLQPSLDRTAETILVETDFAAQHAVALSSFLDVARSYDFFGINGRFQQVDKTYRFAFPSWEMCYFASNLWSAPDCRDYLRYLRPRKGDENPYYAVQYFYEHFRHRFQCASLVDDQLGKTFDIFTQGRPDVDALLLKRSKLLDV